MTDEELIKEIISKHYTPEEGQENEMYWRLMGLINKMKINKEFCAQLREHNTRLALDLWDFKLSKQEGNKS